MTIDDFRDIIERRSAIEAKRNTVMRLRTLCEHSGQHLDIANVKSSPKYSKEDYIVKLVEEEEELEKLENDLDDVLDKAFWALDRIESWELRMVFVERYINGKTWSQVSQKLDISVPALFRMHNKAVSMYFSEEEA